MKQKAQPKRPEPAKPAYLVAILAAGRPLESTPGYHELTRCTACGCRGGLHMASSGKCPKTLAWGNAAPQGYFSLDDQAAFEKADEAYWTANATFYSPVR